MSDELTRENGFSIYFSLGTQESISPFLGSQKKFVDTIEMVKDKKMARTLTI